MRTIIHHHNQWVMNWQPQLLSVLLLSMRIYVAWIFFRAGLLKLDNWSATEYLFQYEYQVPLLPWLWAAYLAVITELFAPVFLLAGLATRLMALGLFGFNTVAVIAYPVLWQDGFVLFSKGAMDHQIWGLMLLIVVVCGAGRWSLDRKLGIK